MSDIESELLALFEAHRRVAEAKSNVLQNYEEPEERGAVIESFERANAKIKLTAIDQVQGEIQRQLEREDKIRQQQERQKHLEE